MQTWRFYSTVKTQAIWLIWLVYQSCHMQNNKQTVLDKFYHCTSYSSIDFNSDSLQNINSAMSNYLYTSGLHLSPSFLASYYWPRSQTKINWSQSLNYFGLSGEINKENKNSQDFFTRETLWYFITSTKKDTKLENMVNNQHRTELEERGRERRRHKQPEAVIVLSYSS